MATISFAFANGSAFGEDAKCGGPNDRCGGTVQQQAKPPHVPESVRILRRQVKNKQRQLQRLHERGRITEKEYKHLSEKLTAYASHVDSVTQDNQLTRDERQALRKELKAYNMDLAESLHGKKDQEADFAEEDGGHGGQTREKQGQTDLHQQNQHGGHLPEIKGGQQQGGKVKSAL